jgi:hypothetical protein
MAGVGARSGTVRAEAHGNAVIAQDRSVAAGHIAVGRDPIISGDFLRAINGEAPKPDLQGATPGVGLVKEMGLERELRRLARE